MSYLHDARHSDAGLATCRRSRRSDRRAPLAAARGYCFDGFACRGGRACGISYRAAWGLLRDYERIFGAPLVQLERGRGASLIGAGRAMAAGANRRSRAPCANPAEPGDRHRTRTAGAHAQLYCACASPRVTTLRSRRLSETLPDRPDRPRPVGDGKPRRLAGIRRRPRRDRRLPRADRRACELGSRPFLDRCARGATSSSASSIASRV